MTEAIDQDQRQAAEHALGELLQLAHSGEMAAAYAYRGHWKSCKDSGQRERIRQIEDEEWEHRKRLRDMLDELGLVPNRWRELRSRCIGRSLGILCQLGGWFLPMYGAGKLESRNVGEYESAARFALACGRVAWVDEFLTMAEVEWDHEAYFRAHVESHWLGTRLKLWPKPAPRESIRT